MNRVYYILFLFLSLALSDSPIWDELPASQIQEDCLSGCDENGVFSINLELFVEDPGNTGEEEGIATIEIIGEVPGASLAEIVEGTLSITPELNWDQDILVSLRL